MKIPIFLIGLFAVSVPALFANPLTGEGLSIGSGNVFENNASVVTNPAAIGDNNVVVNDGHSFLFVGSGNTAFFAYDSLVVGSGNEGDFVSAICVGNNNSSYGFGSLVVGDWNSSFTSSGLVAGSANAIEGSLQFALGRGLASHLHSIHSNDASIYLGKYNISSPAAAPPLLVVGNGTDATHPSNALEIYPNGKIKIPKRQGDIVMGEFGSGNGD